MTNLKPFDLKKYLSGEKVVTKSGYEVTQLNQFFLNKREILVGVMNEGVHTWTMEGKFIVMDGFCENRELFMAPTTKTYWVNVYKSGRGTLLTGDPQLSKEDTDKEYEKIKINYEAYFI